MRVFCLAVFCAALCLRVVAYATADAADPVYIGAWKFTAAVPAPWMNARLKSRSAEPARLLGKTLVFSSKAIVGPAPFACRSPRYALRDFNAGLLFQGAFDEMRRRDRAADPIKIAAHLGFKREPVRTLETGCAFDFHFVDASTAQVGFNDFVYTLKKQN